MKPALIRGAVLQYRGQPKEASAMTATKTKRSTAEKLRRDFTAQFGKGAEQFPATPSSRLSGRRRGEAGKVLKIQCSRQGAAAQ